MILPGRSVLPWAIRMHRSTIGEESRNLSGIAWLATKNVTSAAFLCEKLDHDIMVEWSDWAKDEAPKGYSIKSVQVPLELDDSGHPTDPSEDTGAPPADDYNDPDRNLQGDWDPTDSDNL